MNNKFDRLAPGLPNKLHLLTDLALAVLGIFWSLSFRDTRLTPYAAILALVTVSGWMCAAAITRLYSPTTPRKLLDNILLRLVAVGLVTGFVLAFDSLIGDAAVHLAQPLNFAIFFFCSGTISRVLVFKPLARLSKPSLDVLIVGTGSLGHRTYESLTTAPPENRCNVVGFLTFPGDPETLDFLPGGKILGEARELLAILSKYPVSEVYIAGRMIQHGLQMQEVVDECERVGVPFALPVHSLKFERAKLASSSPARDGYLHYMSTAWKPVQYAVKRLIDITASSLALLILSPILLTVAVVIKVTAPGPIFFRQVRVGLHGAQFNLLKFRSMVVNAEALKQKLQAKNEQTGPVFKMTNDPRITPIGRFIRKYSIDELPQLINILRGDMTIVGPRPALPNEVALYKPWQRRRLSVRPGLTCYWQVGGRNEIGFEEWMRLDLRYVDNWNLGVDVQLILQTFPVVLAGKGAS